jgi:basic amino acid/polyamine antiporter, APA family
MPVPDNQSQRTMGPWMATALVMGVMIGSGVFLLPSQLAPFGWNGVAAWALSITGALALAYILARLTQKLPNAGGPTDFVAAAFGPVPGFMIGWSYWISNLVAMVTFAVAAISYLSIFAPVIGKTAYLPAALAVGLVILITAINLRGSRTAGAFQLVTMAIKLVPLVAVMIIIAVVLTDQGSAAIAPFPKEGLQFSAITSAATLTLWALTGFESASIAAGMVKNSEKNIPRATLLGTALTGFMYIIVCSGIALMLPMALAVNSDAPFTTFVEYFWARKPALLIGLFAAVSAIGAMNGTMVMQAELPQAMARRGMLPAWVAGVNARGIPVRALLLSSFLASLFVIFNASKSMGDLFAYLAKLSTSATLWLYLACALAALRLHVARPVAVLGLIYALWALWGAGMSISALSFVLMLAGLPLYWWARAVRPA